MVSCDLKVLYSKAMSGLARSGVAEPLEEETGTGEVVPFILFSESPFEVGVLEQKQIERDKKQN